MKPSFPHHERFSRAGVMKRMHAYLLSRLGSFYEPLVADRKRALFESLRGEVLEIGPGTGPNLAYYSPGVRWIGVEPNPYMHPYLRDAAKALRRTIEIRPGTAERLPADSASADAVVGTLVLCSVRDPELALQEILRVLKPGGRFVFVEHVSGPAGTRTRRAQQVIQPFWSLLADGCHPNRETWTTIDGAGFHHVCYEHFELPAGFLSPHISGEAVK